MTVGTNMNFQPHLMATTSNNLTRNFPANFYSTQHQQQQQQQQLQQCDPKGLLNGPGQNNCFLNCAVQVSQQSTF
jgi:hypothetical protein